MNTINALRLWGQGEVQLDLDDLRYTLSYLDESSHSALLAFKQDLERQLTKPEPSIKPLPLRVRHLRDLPAWELSGIFNFWDTAHHEIGVWEPPGAPGVCSEWLARGLNHGSTLLEDRPGQLIDLLILDAMHALPGYEVIDVFTPGATPPERPPAGVFQPGENTLDEQKPFAMYAYRNRPVSGTLGSGENFTRIAGSMDAAYSCGECVDYAGGQGAFLKTHLVVAGMRAGPMQDINYDLTQLRGCLAMVQNGQEAVYRAAGSLRGSSGAGVSYGVLSNRRWCRFIEMKPDKTVRVGEPLSTRYDIHVIVQYVRFILAAIMEDY